MAATSPGILNGPVLDAAQWAASVTTVHPSAHRLKNALGLTVGLWGGRYVMDRLVGETPDGEKLDPEDTLGIFRPLHGILGYNHYSDATSDRVKRMVDLWTPAALGAAGAFLGSTNYALEQPGVLGARKALEKAETLTLNKAEDAAIMLQGRMWRFLAGATSVFGSSSNIQLVPGPWNYGTSLSCAFQGTVARNKLHTPYLKPLQQFINGNNHPYPFGPSSMLPKLRDYLVHNPEAEPIRLRSVAKSILEPWFGERVTEGHVDAFLKPMLEARDKVFKKGGVPVADKAALAKTLEGFLLDKGLEAHLTKIGLDPAEAMIGRNGFVERMAKAMGGDKVLERVEDTYRKGLMARHGRKSLPAIAEKAAKNASTLASDRAVLLGGTGAMAALALGVVGMAYNSLSKQEEERKLANETPSPSVDVAAVNNTENKAPAIHTRPRPKEDDSWGSMLFNGFERVTEGLNAATSLSLHRTACALGLTVGGTIGMTVGDIVAGRSLTGQVMESEKVPSFLKSIYKSYAYNPHSDAPKDRWGYVLHFAIPAAFAAAGVVAASDLFFKNRKKQVNKQADYIEDYENRATMTQANAWTPLVAATAPIVTPSGFGYLPFPAPNYGATLGTRFMMAAGRKGVMPGVAELWTGATSKYALGPVALRDHMIKYAVNNPDLHPAQLEEMARGIVRQWFPKATHQQICAFVDKVEQDRNQFYQAGAGIPQAMKEQCEDVLEKHFKGAGLEKTLRDIGLDPVNALLGQNGLAGNISRYLGASDELDSIADEYRGKYSARLKEEQRKAAETPSLQAI